MGSTRAREPPQACRICQRGEPQWGIRVIVGRSTDYTGPGKVKTRSEDWFIAAGAGRDAAKAGKTREDNPYVPNRPDWRAWREGWQCQTLHNEDVTRRYRMAERKYRGRGQVDYTADALADFRAYQSDPTIPPELREVAREILSLVEINARVGMHYSPRHSDELERRSTAQIEDAIARACVRWPNATRNEIVVAVNVTDKRVRESQAWKRHCESRASVENP